MFTSIEIFIYNLKKYKTMILLFLLICVIIFLCIFSFFLYFLKENL